MEPALVVFRRSPDRSPSRFRCVASASGSNSGMERGTQTETQAPEGRLERSRHPIRLSKIDRCHSKRSKFSGTLNFRWDRISLQGEQRMLWSRPNSGKPVQGVSSHHEARSVRIPTGSPGFHNVDVKVLCVEMKTDHAQSYPRKTSHFAEE